MDSKLLSIRSKHVWLGGKMANCSNAIGEIYFEKEFIEKVLLNSPEIFLLWCEHFENTFGKTYYDVDIFYEKTETVPESIPFRGTGKWQFSRNLEWFNHSFNIKFEVEDFIKNESKIQIQEMLERWKENSECKIIFEYSDYEPAEPMLTEQTVEIHYDEILETQQESYEVTVENLVMLNQYGKGDLFDLKSATPIELVLEAKKQNVKLTLEDAEHALNNLDLYWQPFIEKELFSDQLEELLEADSY